MYTKWLLVDSIAKQFDAFKSGFDVVMGDRNLADLFTAEEVELLVCGSKVSYYYYILLLVIILCRSGILILLKKTLVTMGIQRVTLSLGELMN